MGHCARQTRCLSGQAPAGIICAIAIRRIEIVSSQKKQKSIGRVGIREWSISMLAGLNMRCCIYCMRDFGIKFSIDLGHLTVPEPFQKLVNQGLILGEDGQKMSKSRGNVVNPDEVVSGYGADSLRLYEMFMGPLEQVKPWQMKGVEGVSRFLARVWRLVIDGDQVSERITDCACDDKELCRIVHETVKKVGEDIEKLSFNTAISQMMICTNAFVQAKTVPKKELKMFLKVLNPFAPHLTEELNEILGGKTMLCEADWPEYDEEALIQTECELVVQVNGKLRERIWIAKRCERGGSEEARLRNREGKRTDGGEDSKEVNLHSWENHEYCGELGMTMIRKKARNRSASL